MGSRENCNSLRSSSSTETIDAANNHMIMREFVKQQGINNFYDVSEGVCHQVLPEKGHVVPGEVIVGTDSILVHMER